MPKPSARATTDRVGDLLREVGSAPTVERAQAKSEELVRALMDLYGEGLERVLDIVHEAAQERSETIFAALCNDRYVEDLLALHGLHPLSLEDRVCLALDAIRPYLESHAGAVELVRIEDGVAYVRMGGSCDGCRSSAATLKSAVEAAILERVGEISEVRAEGVPVEQTAAAPSLSLQSDWVELAGIPALATAGMARVQCAGVAVLLVRSGATLFAYRDCCPVCTRPYEAATLELPFVRCTACGCRFDVVRAGRVEHHDHLAADPFPLVRDGERVRIAIPLGVRRTSPTNEDGWLGRGRNAMDSSSEAELNPVGV